MPSRSSYPVVKQGHVAPVVYLRGWCVGEGGGARITEHRVDASRAPRDRPPRKVATRARFYRRTRPDTGTEIDDVEATLSVLESKVASILRGVPENWPLEGDERVKLAEFAAMQVVRVPGFMQWHETFTREKFSVDRIDAVTTGKLTSHYARVLDDVESHVLGSTPRLAAMLGIARKLVAVFASMCWTLVEFDRPRLATSDQPVFVWPLEQPSLAPAPSSLSTGFLQTLEIRLPLNARHALLMTWSVNPADEGGRVAGSREDAANFNAFTIANADRDWFSLPGYSPPRGTGRLLPLAPRFIRGYDLDTARESFLRAEVSAQVQPLIGKNLHELDEIPVVKVAHPQAA